MTLSITQRRTRLLRLVNSDEGREFFQFGQRNDARFFDGQTGCSGTVVQLTVWLWTGEHHTLDAIAAAAGYPTAEQARHRTGLTPTQVIRALNHYGVRYQYRGDLTAREIMHVLRERGPVMFTSTYGYWPERKGSVYGGIRADGRTNGYSQPMGEGGKDQLAGFEDGHHMGLAIAKYHRSGTPQGRTQVWVRDPNHGSPRRPHKPSSEFMTLDQFDTLYRSGRYSSDYHAVGAVIPLRRWEGQP